MYHNKELIKYKIKQKYKLKNDLFLCFYVIYINAIIFEK